MAGSQKDAELPSVGHEHLEAHCQYSPLQACPPPSLLAEVVVLVSLASRLLCVHHSVSRLSSELCEPLMERESMLAKAEGNSVVALAWSSP